MGLRVIGRRYDPAEKIEEYFGVDLNRPNRPFELGACSADPALPSIASWGAASTFGFDNLESIEATAFRDWRAALGRMQCGWVVSIIEESRPSADVEAAAKEVIRHADARMSAPGRYVRS